MEKYIRMIQKIREEISRRFNTGVSRSCRAYAALAALAEALAAPLTDAPYPAASTAAMIAWAEAVPSTPMELVRRLTEQDVTPGTFDTAFSTLALQAAQLMPVTLYCSMEYLPRPGFFLSSHGLSFLFHQFL